MTAQASLFTEKIKPMLRTCSCGHDIEQHADLRRECEYGKETKFGGCTCKKFVPKGRPPVPQAPSLAPPLGAVILMRPDTVRPKAMGWAWVQMGTGLKLTIYLDHLRTKSLNEQRRIYHANLPRARMAQMQAAMANAIKAVVTRTQCAVEENAPQERGRLRSLVLTRIMSGRGLDGDNLEGALKACRDGVADALRVDDRSFDGLISYEQRPPGKRGVFGVMIELVWGGA